MVTKAELGQYAIAYLMLNAVVQTYHLLARKVLFPLYSEIGQEGGPELRRRAYRIRLALMGLMLPPIWLLACAGEPIIHLLYDERYAEAGWMLEWIACGATFMMVSAIGPIQLARGESWINLMVTGIRSGVLLGAMILGGRLAGTPGIIAAIGAAYLVHYPDAGVDRAPLRRVAPGARRDRHRGQRGGAGPRALRALGPPLREGPSGPPGSSRGRSPPACTARHRSGSSPGSCRARLHAPR